MDDFQREAIQLNLDKLLNGSPSFSICAVDEMGKLLGVNPESHPDYKVLRALHCVRYTEMSSAMKAELPNKVMNCLASSFDTGLMSRALMAVANGEVKSLPAIEDLEVNESPRLRLFKS